SRRDGYRNETYFYEGMVTSIQLITIAIVIFGGIAILNGTLDLGDLITYLLFVAILIDPIQKFANLARLYHEGITGFTRFMEILEVQPDIQDAPHAVELAHVRGNVEFRNVSFKYHNDHNHVLKNICLNIKVGEYI